jgi:hypothetical protein
MEKKVIIVFASLLLAVGLIAFLAHSTSTKPRDVNGLNAPLTPEALSALENPQKKVELERLIRERGITEEGFYEVFQEVYGIDYKASLLYQSSSDPGPVPLHDGGPDLYGYKFEHIPFNFLNLQDSSVDPTVIEVEMGDDSWFDIALPHTFCLYDQNINVIRVHSNGFLTTPPFAGGFFVNDPIPLAGAPENVIAPYWDDLWGLGGPADRELRYKHLAGGGRTIDTTIIQYNNWGFLFDFGQARNTFQVILESTGYITFNYLNVDSTLPFGPHSATSGIENSTGTIGLQLAFNQIDGNGHIKDSTSMQITPCNPCPIQPAGFIEDRVVIDYTPSCNNWNHEDVLKTEVEVEVCLDMEDVCVDVLEHLQNEDLLEWVKIDFVEPPCYQFVEGGGTVTFKLVTPIRIGQLAGQYVGKVELHATIIATGDVVKDTLEVVLNVGECHDMDIKDDYANLDGNVMDIQATSRSKGGGSEYSLRAFDIGLPNAREENHDEYDGPGNTPIDCVTCEFVEWSPLWHEDDHDHHYHENFFFTGVGSVTGDMCDWEPGHWRRMFVGLAIPPMKGTENHPGTYKGRLDCWAIIRGDTVDHDYFDIQVRLARRVGPPSTSSSSFGGEPTEDGILIYWGDFSGVGLAGKVNLYREDPKTGTYFMIENAPKSQRSTYLDVDVLPGISYNYKLGINYNGNELYFGPIKVGGVGQAPRTYALYQNAPNPFLKSTAIQYQLPAKGRVSLKVYDLTGRLVSTLVNGEEEAGFYTISWNRQDSKGRRLSNGVYFYRLVSGDFTTTKKMVVLR